MRIIPAFSLLLALASAALAQTHFQPSDSPDVTVTVQPAPSNSVFFAASGNDSNPCTQAAPCQTLAKASAMSYHPGTTINFNGGDTFLGELHIQRAQVPSGGDPNNPIIIGSYGTGRATIASNVSGVNQPGNTGEGPLNWGILLDCTSGVTVQDLNITANGHYVQYGILIQNSCGNWAPIVFSLQQAAGMISNIIVQRVDVGGFGIQVPASGSQGGGQVYIAGLSKVPGGPGQNPCGPINNVLIADSKLHGNDGLTSHVDNGVRTNHCGNLWNLTYRGNEVFNIGGMPGYPTSGNGLLMTGVVSGGLMEHNHVHHNMGGNPGACGGPYAMWTFEVTGNMIIQFNEVDHNAPAPNPVQGTCDFGAFDFDASTYSSVLQYNYSHDNWGPFANIFFSAGHIIRYNISINDNASGSTGGGAAILSAQAVSINVNDGTNTMLGGLGTIQVYNNTIVSNTGCFSTVTAPETGSLIENNICIATEADQFGRAFFLGVGQNGNLTNVAISNNIYFATTGNPLFPAALTCCFAPGSFSGWQSLGKDQNSQYVNPFIPTSSQTITWDPTQHTGPQPGPSNDHLPSGSPAQGAGVAITNNGGRDYYGGTVTSPPSVGAAQ